ncbi:MAG: DUF222 domain-containing protein [Gammaproteobacteria bacterium]|nr:DUF222 domain-containing protein [Gammaproteobacteria bacterium]MDP2348283.1 DUF222 domain-containing protein [Gammaproteobacteria bacterium]
MTHTSALAAMPVYTSFIPEDNATLSNEITRLAGHINAAQHRFLKLLAALIERNAWEGAGMKSPAHWLNYHCGIDLGAAREKVRVAKCLANLPSIDEAFRSGEISYSKVRAMTRSATPQNEAFLLQIARHGTAQHMEQLTRKYRRTERLSDAARDRNNYEAREFTCHFDEDGMLVLRARLTPEDGAVFMKAMDAMMVALNPPVAASEMSAMSEVAEASHASEISSRKTFLQKRADALLAIAEQAVSTMEEGLKPVFSAEKYQVVVHIERERIAMADGAAVDANNAVPNSSDLNGTHGHQHADLLADQQAIHHADHHQCTIECGTSHFPLSEATTRRLCCDASMVTVLEDFSGNVLDIGRRTRTIPPSIRRALQIRDGGCRFPGCCESRYVDAHHVRHWCDGGETKMDNLVLLCRHHHRLLHQEGYEIKRGADGVFEFVTPQGRRMARAVSPQFVEVDRLTETLAIEREHDQIGLQIDARTAVTLWQGERMDYDMAVGAMLSARELPPGGLGARWTST